MSKVNPVRQDTGAYSQIEGTCTGNGGAKVRTWRNYQLKLDVKSGGREGGQGSRNLDLKDTERAEG